MMVHVRRRWLGILGMAIPLACAVSTARAPAEDKPNVDPAALERTRQSVKMVDDLYKSAVVSMTERYVEDQSANPAALVAKDVFVAMAKKGWHAARLVDATGKPKNEENVAKTDFEKRAVARIKAGVPFYEEVAEKDGKPVLRVGTVVPVVLKQCAVCHGRKQGSVLGAILYEVPIK